MRLRGRRDVDPINDTGPISDTNDAGSRAEGRNLSDDSGYVALMAIITLPFFLLLLGFSLDVAHWRLMAHRAQAAADAAALAGAAYLPQDMPGATSIAKAVANQNYLPTGSTVSVSAGDRASQIDVSVTTPVKNALFGLFKGGATTNITRHAVAEYQGPLAMGSPCNLFGDEPPKLVSTDKLWESSKCSTSGGFWANIAGPQSAKANGDALHANQCSTGVDGCVGSVNTDYDKDGYSYMVHVSAPVARMQIQVYDPAFVNVGDHCTDNLAGIPVPNLGLNFYAAGDGPFCTGDQLFSGGSGDGNPPVTSFVVRAPSGNSADPTDGTPIAGCTKQYAGYSGTLLSRIVGQLYPFAVFRKWVTLCDITNVVAGDYTIQVRTDVPLGLDAATDPGTPGLAGGGHNRFSIRAGMPADDATNSKISIHGSAAMAMYANVPGVVTEFFMARLPSGSKGHVLTLQLFDIGDASTSGSLTVKAPPLSGVNFTNCVASGPQTGTLSSCTITATSAFNGKWETLKVPIPTNYKCVDTDITDCWVRIQYNYGAGTQVQDTTTWKASVDGDPVRLLE